MTTRHFLVFCCFTLLVNWRAAAQFTPQGFNYQCIVRDGTGASLNNQTVNLLFTIRNGAPNGPVAYSEKQNSATNEFGLVNLVIGQGTPLQGVFNTINWGNGAKFLTVSLETAPNVFDELGSTQLMSVPYALYSQTAANGGGDNWGTQAVKTAPALSGDGTTGTPLNLAQQGAQTGQVLKWNGTDWVPQDDKVNPGTLTEINTGTGLTGGPISSTGTISLANTTVAPGSYGSPTQIPVVTVDAQGRITDVQTVVPQPSTVGITGAAGINVSQNGVNFTITNTGDTDASDDVTNTTQANGDVAGPFSNLQIKANAVGSPEIADNAVGTSEIADNAVVNSKLADNSVGTSKLQDGSVTAVKLNNMGATAGQVLKWNGTTWAPAVDNLGTISLSAGPGINIGGTSPNFTVNNTGDTDASDDITTASVANGDITGPFSNLQLKPDVVGSTELASAAVTTPKIGAGAVSGDKISQMSASSGEVLKWNGTTWAPATDDIGSISIIGGVGIDVIAVGTNFTVANSGDVNPFDDILNTTIANGDVTGTYDNLQIKQFAVTSFELGTNSVITTKIQNGAVTGDKINQMSALNGQVLKWNGTTWAPAVDNVGNGDNWGAQVAITGPSLTGDGTAISPLKIAQQGAANGQVLQWNGTSWVPGNNVGDNWGTQAAVTNPTIDGDGTNGDPLRLAQQNATSGQVLKWNGSNWSPGDDNNTGDDWGGQVAVTNPTIAGDGTPGDPLRIAQQDATIGQVLKWDGILWEEADDTWGVQAIESSPEFEGNGVLATPLKLAQQNATPGQVLKWNGVLWAPDDDIAGGDDWGTQAALTNATLTGDGTIGNELGLAQQSATPGQVLKWNGSSWTPADDNNTGDDWGGQVVVTNPTIAGDGTPGDPLRIAQQDATVGQVLKWDGVLWEEADDTWGVQAIESSPEFEGNGVLATPLKLAQQSAATGQVLKWNGSSWTPADDLIGIGGGGNTYLAGPGITITGTAPNLTISNTGDLSNTNELQTLDLTGNQLTLSDGGGTVLLNTYASGAGINITGSAPSFTILNTGDLSNTNELQTLSLVGNQLSLSSGGGSVNLPPSNAYAAGTGINITGSAPNFTIFNTGDADSNPTNEIQTLSLAGDTLSLSKGGGMINLPSANHYAAGTGIDITGSAPNFTIVNTGDADNDPTNELQNLSLNGKILTISGTNSQVDLDTVLVNTGIGLWAGNATNIYNANTGNVGIGTNAPARKLHVKANGEAVRIEGADPYIGLVNGTGDVDAFWGLSGSYLTMGTNDSSSIVMATAGGKALYIDGLNANVGIGGINGAARLKVYHNDASGGFMLENSSSGANWEFRVDPVTGNLVLYNSTLGAIPAGAFSTFGVYTPSDRRLKKDIADLPGVLDKIKQLNPVTYRYKQQNAGSQASIGFIAQDVQQYFPELVSENSARDGNRFLSLNYAGFSVLAVKAIQEQQGQIESLQKENSDLLTRLNDLEKRMQQLEQTSRNTTTGNK